ARAEVVREGDATPAGAVVRDSAVLRELVASPQHENAAIGLEEARLLDVHRGRPAQCLVESLRSPVIRYAERHQADALLHGEAEPTGSDRWNGLRSRRLRTVPDQPVAQSTCPEPRGGHEQAGGDVEEVVVAGRDDRQAHERAPE